MVDERCEEYAKLSLLIGDFYSRNFQGTETEIDRYVYQVLQSKLHLLGKNIRESL